MRTFQQFVARKTREAERAKIPPLQTLEDRTHTRAGRGVGNAWTWRQYDGPFLLIEPPATLPAVGLVFVRSRDGNTVADNPDELGGGPTDKHVIYEGLSRVAADAVLAGAATAAGPDVFFSVWHPAIVALRQHLGLPRHPVQIVISRDGHLDLDRTLLFNVPDVPVVILAGAECQRRCAAALANRPWITVVPLGTGGLAEAFVHLRREHRLTRISAIGGPTTASRLIDAGLVQDLCLTSTTRQAGRPRTPFYNGQRELVLDVIVRKRGTDEEAPIVFEHLAIETPALL